MGDERDARDGVALEGEVVVATPRSRHRQSYFTEEHEDMIRKIIQARIAGRTLADIGKEFGVSAQNVHRWVGEAQQARRAVDPDALRGEAAMHLETARDEAWKLFRAAKVAGKPKVMIDSLVRIESLTMAEARLMGAVRPARIDVTVTALTDAERELQEMLDEARAQVAAGERAVIDAASKDPAL